MLEFVFMPARSDTGAGQTVALVRTLRATPPGGTPTDEHVFVFSLIFVFFPILSNCGLLSRISDEEAIRRLTEKRPTTEF